MKISTCGEYAVRILVEIASADSYVSLKDVANRLDISLKYAEKIASKLLKQKLIESLRGQDGGYKLAKSAKESTVREVLEATGDIKPVVACLATDCPHKTTCKSVSVWQRLDSLINNYLDTVTIYDLLEKKD